MNTRIAIPASQLPDSVPLTQATFAAPKPSTPYTSPTDSTSSWMSPGPVAGPFHVTLSDDSTVTYYWYRFVDQPALQRFNLSADAKTQLQHRVELLQANSPIDNDYMAPPTLGELANLDSALVVTPPPGLEIGFVPIVTRQEVRPQPQQ